MDDTPFAWGPPGHGARRLRAVRRAAAVLAFTLPSMAVQAALLTAAGRGKVRFARAYWAGVTRLLGVRVQVLGTPVTGGPRPVVFVANHASWLDIGVLGGTLHACFVAKAEVGRWPVIRTIARLGRTVFVSRRARDTAAERDAMQGRLAAGDNLVLFPEGTSNDGSRVLPFRSSFFAICDGPAGGASPLVQPVSVVYDRLGGMPAGRSSRALFAWYGDMELAPHFWRLAGEQGMRATVLLHPPLDPADFPSRKALAAEAWSRVAKGAAHLRQNRPVEGA